MRHKEIEQFSQEKLEKKEAQEISSIEHNIKKYSANFIHGIRPGFTPEYNSLLNKDVDWKTKTLLFLTLEPSSSVSTIKEGNSENNMFSRIGIILKDGQIEAASPTDVGSFAIKAGKRIDLRSSRQQIPIDQQIEEAINSNPAKRKYNEFIIQKPKTAGFYVSLDEMDPKQKKYYNIPIKDIIEFTSSLNMPIYAFKKGVLYEAEYNKETNELIPLNKLSPKEIIKSKLQIPEEKKNKILAELFESSPFKTSKNIESIIKSNADGKKIYNILAKQKDFLTDLNENEKHVYEEIKRALNLGFISTGYTTITTEQNLKSAENIKPIIDKNNYLSIISENITKALQKRKSAKEYEKTWLNELAFNLYGFGEEAEKNNDIETQTKAWELAKQILPFDEYKKVLQERIGKSGKVKMTKEEWQEILSQNY